MAGLAIDKGEGPLAPWLAAAPAQPETESVLVVSDEAREAENAADEGDDGGRGRGNDVMRELHETFGSLTLFLVLAHIGGVALASFAHRENLVRAMITGRKRAGDAVDL
jgi:cytochrome b